MKIENLENFQQFGIVTAVPVYAFYRVLFDYGK